MQCRRLWPWIKNRLWINRKFSCNSGDAVRNACAVLCCATAAKLSHGRRRTQSRPQKENATVRGRVKVCTVIAEQQVIWSNVSGADWKKHCNCLQSIGLVYVANDLNRNNIVTICTLKCTILAHVIFNTVVFFFFRFFIRQCTTITEAIGGRLYESNMICFCTCFHRHEMCLRAFQLFLLPCCRWDSFYAMKWATLNSLRLHSSKGTNSSFIRCFSDPLIQGTLQPRFHYETCCWSHVKLWIILWKITISAI